MARQFVSGSISFTVPGPFASVLRVHLLDLIGNTPLLDLSALTGRPEVKLYAKAELANPGGSVKDRPALAMVRDAERRGLFAGGGACSIPRRATPGSPTP